MVNLVQSWVSGNSFFRRCGVTQAESIDESFDIPRSCVVGTLPANDRVAMVPVSVGVRALMADGVNSWSRRLWRRHGSAFLSACRSGWPVTPSTGLRRGDDRVGHRLPAPDGPSTQSSSPAQPPNDRARITVAAWSVADRMHSPILGIPRALLAGVQWTKFFQKTAAESGIPAHHHNHPTPSTCKRYVE